LDLVALLQERGPNKHSEMRMLGRYTPSESIGIVGQAVQRTKLVHEKVERTTVKHAKSDRHTKIERTKVGNVKATCRRKGKKITPEQ